jgi:CRISPR/Cas system CSM-associated protein Csm2 small subunit
LEKNGAKNVTAATKTDPLYGDPARYQRFRSNFRDQVECKSTLSDSEKMNYLMAYTTGRAREAIETYEGLPNGYQLALNVLQQRLEQMIVQAF